MPEPADLDGRRLLVLGAGRHQVPVIRRARERGASVVTVDYLPDAPGRIEADIAILADALDIDTAIRVGREHAVDGVLTVGTDQALLTVASVAAALDLPCHLDPDSARAATSKEEMRRRLVGAGVPMAAGWVLGSAGRGSGWSAKIEEIAATGTGPWVVKPADAQGQRGTSRVDGRGELYDAVDRAREASREGTVVVEEFLEGPEVTASAWVHDGDVELLGITDRVTYNPPPHLGIALRHVYPSRHARHLRERTISVLGRIASAYGLIAGPLYVQMIVTPEGPVVVEAAARVGGGHEPNLYQAVSGVDLIDLSIDLAVGCARRAPMDPAGSDREAHGLVNFVVARPGTVARAEPMKPLIDEGLIREGSWYRSRGHVQDRVRDGQGRVGWFLATAVDHSQLIDTAQSAYDRLRLLDERGRNLVYWPDEPLLRGL